MAALGRIFDGLGRPDAAVRAAAPAAPGQVFDAASRKLTADLLRSRLLQETRGTWAGQDLAAFYADHPLNVVVAPTEMSAIAWYQHDVLSFNEKFIQEFVKARGRGVSDLAADPALLGDLAKETAPTFVHEATHQMQDAWAKQLKIPFYGGEGPEKEGKTVAALFVLQKEKIDPAYRRFIEKNAPSSTFVREDQAEAEELRRSGSDWFGIEMMTSCYPGFPSIAGNAWSNIGVRDRIDAAVNAELARRSKLPAAGAQALAAQQGFVKSYSSTEAFITDFPHVNDEALRDLAGQLLRANDSEPAVYRDYTQRLDETNRLADERLKALARGGSAAVDVPLPSSLNR